jgi:hypothetical protein
LGCQAEWTFIPQYPSADTKSSPAFSKPSVKAAFGCAIHPTTDFDAERAPPPPIPIPVTRFASASFLQGWGVKSGIDLVDNYPSKESG